MVEIKLSFTEWAGFSGMWHVEGSGSWINEPLAKMIQTRDEWAWKVALSEDTYPDHNAMSAVRQLDAIIAEKIARGEQAPTEEPPFHAVQVFGRTWELFVARGPVILHRKTVQTRADGSPAMNPVRLLATWGYKPVGKWEWHEHESSWAASYWANNASRVEVAPDGD